MKRITILFVCLFGVLGSGYCQEKRLYNHYYLTETSAKPSFIEKFPFSRV